MSNTIKLKRGSGSDPSASDLVVGELALRTDNGKIFTKKDNGSVAEISGGGGIDDGDKGDITATTIDMNGNLDVSGTITSGGVVTATGFTIGSAAITEAELEILDGATVTTAELNILDGVTSTASEINVLDGITSTTTELNIVDGNTSATSTTLATADRIVVNDNGTMKQVALSDLVTFLEDGSTSGFDIDGGTY